MSYTERVAAIMCETGRDITPEFLNANPAAREIIALQRDIGCGPRTAAYAVECAIF